MASSSSSIPSNLKKLQFLPKSLTMLRDLVPVMISYFPVRDLVDALQTSGKVVEPPQMEMYAKLKQSFEERLSKLQDHPRVAVETYEDARNLRRLLPTYAYKLGKEDQVQKWPRDVLFHDDNPGQAKRHVQDILGREYEVAIVKDEIMYQH